MNKYKLQLGVVILGLGICGVLSLLSMDMSAVIPAEVAARVSPTALKWLVLINPTILVLLFTVLGVYTHEKARFEVPQIKAFLTKESPSISFFNQAQSGILGGVVAGLVIVLSSQLITPYVTKEYLELTEKLNPSPLARFLYGGITEEILVRFGLMSFFAFLFSKLFKGFQPAVYWISILIAAILFGLGHLPVLFQAIPNPNIALVVFIIALNSIAGIIFGYLYWKKGLESAFVAHIFAHVTMLLAAML